MKLTFPLWGLGGPDSWIKILCSRFFSFSYCFLFPPCPPPPPPPAFADGFTFSLSVAKCRLVFHYSHLCFAVFISDTISPLWLLARSCAPVPSGGSTICTLFTRLIHNLHCVVCVFFPMFLRCVERACCQELRGGESMAPIPCQSPSLCGSFVSRVGMRVMMVNAFPMNMNAPTKHPCVSAAGSTTDLPPPP